MIAVAIVTWQLKGGLCAACALVSRRVKVCAKCALIGDEKLFTLF